jgi:hypothetical protein
VLLLLQVALLLLLSQPLLLRRRSVRLVLHSAFAVGNGASSCDKSNQRRPEQETPNTDAGVSRYSHGRRQNASTPRSPCGKQLSSERQLVLNK